MVKFITLFFLVALPSVLIAQKTMLKEVLFYKSDQVKQAYFVLKKNENIKHGLYQSFYENGKLKEGGEYVDNLKTGMWNYFNSDGKNQKIRIYENGRKRSEKKVGIWEEIFEGGQVIKRYDYDKKEALKTIIQVSIKYPDAARENNIQGLVEVKLKLDKDCMIQEITILKSIGYGCDEVALESIIKLAEFCKEYDQMECTGIERIIPVHFKLD